MKYLFLFNKVSFILTPLPSPPWGRVQVDRALVEGVNGGGGPHIIVKNHETHSTELSKLVNEKRRTLNRVVDFEYLNF